MDVLYKMEYYINAAQQPWVEMDVLYKMEYYINAVTKFNGIRWIVLRCKGIQRFATYVVNARIIALGENGYRAP